jgi:transposase
VSDSTSESDRIVIGIDPHKASWTAAAVGPGLRPLATIRVPVDQDGYRNLCRFAARWTDVVWAIEGAGGLGAPLATRLSADGIAAVDVPAKLAARVRVLSTGHGRKNDDADAISVAVAAMSAAGLRTVTVDEAVTALRALVEHRDDVVKTRTQTVNRLHALLTQLLPAGAPRGLSADTAAQLLRPVRPRGIAARTLRRLAAELITEIRHLDRRISVANTKITHAVQASRSTLTELRGIGHLDAGEDPRPGRGRAPLPLRRRVRLLHRHRPHRGVLRRRRTAPTLPRRGPPAQLLPAHHGHHPTPTRLPGPHLLPAQTSRREEPQRSPALPQAATVRRGLPVPDPRRRPAERGGPGRTPGGDYELQRGRLNPYHRPFGQVTSRTRHDRPYNLTQDPLDTERSRLIEH